MLLLFPYWKKEENNVQRNNLINVFSAFYCELENETKSSIFAMQLVQISFEDNHDYVTFLFPFLSFQHSWQTN